MSLAAELLDQWAPVLDGVELKSGSKGRFEVELDGELLFSKARLARFPAAGEVTKIIRERLGQPPAWRPTH